MKKLVIQLAVFFSSLFIFSNLYSYNIKVKVNGLKDSTCYLGHYFGQKQYTPIDTAKADANGNVVFSGKNKLKEGVYLVIIPKSYIEVIITSEQDIKIETDTSDLIGKMVTKGSYDNDLFYGFQKSMVQKSTEYQKISDAMKNMKNKDSLQAAKDQLLGIQTYIKDYRENLFKQNPTSFTTKILKAAEDPQVPEFKLSDGKTDSLRAFNYYKDHYFDNMDFSDERMLRSPIFIPKIDRYMKDLTLQTPDSIISSANKLIKKAEANKEIYKYCVSNITNTYETSSMMGMDAVFVYMADNYYLKGKCFWIDTAVERKIRERANLLRPLLLGKVAPNMYMADTTTPGNYVIMNTIKAKYLILCFWDADCGHCQKEVPKLFELYNTDLKKKGVKIYAPTIERDDKSWMKFIKEKKLFSEGWYNVRDKYNHTDFKITYDVYSTPVIYVLDESKKIIAKRIGVDQLKDFIENYDKRNSKK